MKSKRSRIKAFDREELDLLRFNCYWGKFFRTPLARAIIKRAEQELGSITQLPEKAEMIAGQGLKAMIEGKTLLIGNRKRFMEHNIAIEDREVDIWLVAGGGSF